MFEEKNRSMVLGVIRTITEKGRFASKKEAVKKLKDTAWLKNEGYGHVSHILSGDIGMQECEKFFDELDKRLMKRLTSGIHQFK